jgi:hypothetical protein
MTRPRSCSNQARSGDEIGDAAIIIPRGHDDIDPKGFHQVVDPTAIEVLATGGGAVAPAHVDAVSPVLDRPGGRLHDISGGGAFGIRDAADVIEALSVRREDLVDPEGPPSSPVVRGGDHPGHVRGMAVDVGAAGIPVEHVMGGIVAERVDVIDPRILVYSDFGAGARGGGPDQEIEVGGRRIVAVPDQILRDVVDRDDGGVPRQSVELPGVQAGEEDRDQSSQLDGPPRVLAASAAGVWATRTRAAMAGRSGLSPRAKEPGSGRATQMATGTRSAGLCCRRAWRPGASLP